MNRAIPTPAKGLSEAQRRIVAGHQVLEIGHRLVLQDGRDPTLRALRRLGIIEDSRFGSTTFSELGRQLRDHLQGGEYRAGDADPFADRAEEGVKS